MSGINSALARMGAIERMVSGVRAPGLPASTGTAGATSTAGVAATTGAAASAATTGGPTIATSFADALDQAVRIDAAAAPVVAPGATPAPAGYARGVIGRPSASGVGSVATTSGSRTERTADAAYRPAHVTETDEKVWNDCTWASAAMWIDKLTGGSVKVDREALRAASGDKTGGSNLGDVVRGARKLLGLDLRDAHDEKLTVDALLDRLAAGGGAIVQGSYASLPSKLTRHDPGFAAKGVAGSGHAVYVGPLDRSTGKVWWDDPLAPAGGSGEWIDVKDLRAFMWTDAKGRVSAMATPAGASGSTAAGASIARAGAAGSSGASASGTAASGASGSARDAASIAAAAWTAGVDPLLLTAYLDATDSPGDALSVATAAGDLGAALARYGRADRALESLGSATGGAAFARDVLAAWSKLVDRSTGS